MVDDLVIAPGVVLPATDLHWTAVRSSGPGGQNVNKVATKVELRFDLETTSALHPAVKARLRVLARGRLDAEGRIVVTSQATRTLPQNLSDALEKLAELVRGALTPPKPRRPTKPTRASRVRRLEGKRHQSERKESRSMPRHDD